MTCPYPPKQSDLKKLMKCRAETSALQGVQAKSALPIQLEGGDEVVIGKGGRSILG